jgi:tetratricopeptide (TPR) repeat protein
VGDRSRSRLVAAALLAVVLLVYARSLGSGFVYDAVAQIGEDDFIHTPANLTDVVTLRVMARDVLDFNRPVQLLSLMLDALAWGRRPLGYHLTSVALHACCVLLLFGLVLRWLEREGRPALGPAALAALFFAVHPLAVEAVAEPSYREELLVALFLLLALWLVERRRRWADAGVVACAVLAIGAKETGVALVPVLVAWWWLTGRERRFVWALALAAVAQGLFIWARFALATADSQVFRQPATYLGGSLGAALAIEPRIWALALQHLVWPVHLSADYTAASIAHLPLALAIAIVLAFLGVQLVVARRSPLGRLALVIFWAALLPASNLLPMYRPAADRYLYVPLLGVAGALAVLLGPLWERPRWRALPLLVLAALAVATVRRQAVWKDELALWSDTLARTPTSRTAVNNLGWAMLEAGQLAEAERLFTHAARGHDADPWAGLALAFEARGRHDQALMALGRAVSLDPVYGDPAALHRTLRLTRAQIERLRPLIDALPRR